jgi:hypothetical protein
MRSYDEQPSTPKIVEEINKLATNFIRYNGRSPTNIAMSRDKLYELQDSICSRDGYYVPGAYAVDPATPDKVRGLIISILENHRTENYMEVL